MGIKSNFNQFLREKCPDIFEEIHISEYAFKRVAIDISLYLHKFKAVCGDRWLSAFINLIACLRRNETHCVFIFDGKAPEEKNEERVKRREDREKMDKNLFILEEALEEFDKTGIVGKPLIDLYERRRSPQRLLGKSNTVFDIEWVRKKIEQKRNQIYEITPEDYQHAMELFDILEVPYYTAPCEAEKMCSKLCRDGRVCAVLSEDTDVLAYAAPIFLSKIDTSTNTCVRIRHKYVLEGLGLTELQFLDFCIMCGTDYNPNIPKVGSKTAYKHIYQHGGIDEISSNTNLNTSILKHQRSRELFSTFPEYNVDNIPYCGCPDFDALEKFIIKHKIHLNLEKLRNDFTQNVIVFEDSENEDEAQNMEEVVLPDSDKEQENK